tara:strand:- start:242 stop:862 length:621 start_codon:yes stop_codon:yes gene_type:complete
MRVIIHLLIIVGFCAASLGAAGLGKPSDADSVSQSMAVTIFITGSLLLVICGLVTKSLKKSAGAEDTEANEPADDFASLLAEISREIRQLDDSRAGLAPAELTERINSLLKNQYFDLTSRNEELAALLGFSVYATIWDGVASAERLLLRAWSMATDEHFDEAIQELPRARSHIERACAAMQGVGPGTDAIEKESTAWGDDPGAAES